jgi:hypothetical protein
VGTVRDVSLLSGQELQSLACLQWHYDREYVIAVTGGAWQARRRNREGESEIVILTAQSAFELRDKIRGDYAQTARIRHLSQPRRGQGCSI